MLRAVAASAEGATSTSTPSVRLTVTEYGHHEPFNAAFPNPRWGKKA